MNLISILRRGLVHLMAQSKILLVDDEIKTRQLFSRLLSNQGFIVQTASDGEKALIKANEFQPNCILLDVRMPHGGLGLLSRFRKKLLPHFKGGVDTRKNLKYPLGPKHEVC